MGTMMIDTKLLRKLNIKNTVKVKWFNDLFCPFSFTQYSTQIKLQTTYDIKTLIALHN